MTRPIVLLTRPPIAAPPGADDAADLVAALARRGVRATLTTDFVAGFAARNDAPLVHATFPVIGAGVVRPVDAFARVADACAAVEAAAPGAIVWAAACESERDAMARRLGPAARVRVLRSGIDTASPTTPPAAAATSACVGASPPDRRESARRALGATPDETIHLACAAESDRVRGALATLPPAPRRLVIAPMLAELAGSDAFAAADVFAHPTVGDPMSRAALAAIVAGLPTVVSAECAAADLLRGTAAGAVVDDPADVAALAAALLRFESPAVRARARATLGAFDVARAASLDRLAENALALYAEALADPGAARIS